MSPHPAISNNATVNISSDVVSDILTLPVDIGLMVVVVHHMGLYVWCFENSHIIAHMAGLIYSPSSSLGELYFFYILNIVYLFDRSQGTNFVIFGGLILDGWIAWHASCSVARY